MSAASQSLRRLRLVLPPGGSLTSFAIMFLLAEIPLRAFEAWWGGNLPHPARYVLTFASLVVGFRRATTFHPYFDPAYHDWLARTPWTRGRPLPGGPVFPVPEDLLVLGGLVLLAMTQPDLRPESVVTRFLVGYAAGLTIPMWWAGASVHGYLCLFGLGLVARLWRTPYALPAAAALLPVALMGLWRTLGAVSRRIETKVPKLPTATSELAEIESTVLCGWPFDQLSPKAIARNRAGTLDRILAAQTIGWLLYGACGLFEEEGSRRTLLWFAFGGSMLVLTVGRYAVYRAGTAPPITFWGRFASFRPIVPGYDQIALAPLVTIGAVAAAAYELRRLDLDLDFTMSALTAIAWLVALNTGPSLEAWRLTGELRLVPNTASKGTEFVNTT